MSEAALSCCVLLLEFVLGVKQGYIETAMEVNRQLESRRHVRQACNAIKNLTDLTQNSHANRALIRILWSVLVKARNKIKGRNAVKTFYTLCLIFYGISVTCSAIMTFVTVMMFLSQAAQGRVGHDCVGGDHLQFSTRRYMWAMSGSSPLLSKGLR